MRLLLAVARALLIWLCAVARVLLLAAWRLVLLTLKAWGLGRLLAARCLGLCVALQRSAARPVERLALSIQAAALSWRMRLACLRKKQRCWPMRWKACHLSLWLAAR